MAYINKDVFFAHHRYPLKVSCWLALGYLSSVIQTDTVAFIHNTSKEERSCEPQSNFQKFSLYFIDHIKDQKGGVL